VLTAVEQGMRNHELVPVELITSIARLRHGGSYKIMSTLLRFKLLAHEQHKYDGYRLSYLGYDILALRTLLSRGTICSVGSQIGVGKESDIFEAQNENGDEVVIKIHRLGRTSFRAVRKNRDYMQNKSKANWLYMSRLAAVKEFAFMEALHAHDFPTPIPIDQNRHIVVMNRISGFPMSQIKAGNMEGARDIFRRCLIILKRLASHGLVHCDFNEFNLMIDDQANLTMIDFPQMVPVSHPNAADLFKRDLNCLIKFFAMKMRYVATDDEQDLVLSDLVEATDDEAFAGGIYDQVKNSKGLSSAEDNTLIEFIMHSNEMSEEMMAARKDGRVTGEEGSSDEYASDESENESEIGGVEESADDNDSASALVATSASSGGVDIDIAGVGAGVEGTSMARGGQTEDGPVVPESCWRVLNASAGTSSAGVAAVGTQDQEEPAEANGMRKLESGVEDGEEEEEEEGSQAGSIAGMSEFDIRNKIRR
jgi:RIO kinase 2